MTIPHVERLRAIDVGFSYPKFSRGVLLKNGNARDTTALRNIDLKVQVNDSLGIIGTNGSGKTTLLRILSRIYEPTTGDMIVSGNVATMFDSGYGLDLERNPSENIRLRGYLLSKPKGEIETAIDEIEEFVQLGTKWRDPLRYYSTGMISRVIIGLATAFKADILLMDEGIGAADQQFQKKTAERFGQMLSLSGCVVMASHNQNLMESCCKRAILLRDGRIIDEGSVSEMWRKQERF